MRNVIVTGGSRGLGLEISRVLAIAGFRVVAVARRESDQLRHLAAELRGDAAGAILFRSLDLTETGQFGDFVRDLHKEIGPLWGLVNNAGLGTDGLLATMPDAAAEKLICLNTVAPVLFTKYVVRAMMADGKGGRIVNMSSITAATGYQGLSVYAATKASMVGFTKSLAREVGRLGITVNAVAPGFIATDMTSGLDDGQRDQLVRRSALRRLADPVDIAEAVAYLVSDKARNVTGTTLTIDAGNTA